MEPNVIIDKILPFLNEGVYQNLNIESLLASSKVPKHEFYSSFSGMDDLIAKIFYRFCEESDIMCAGIDQDAISLENLFQILVESSELQIKYRFFFFNLRPINNDHELIKDRYLESLALRKAQIIHLFNLLKDEGVFVKEKLPGNYENLANQMTLLTDFWLSHNQVVFGPDDVRLPYYSKLIFSLIVPYLTENGLEDYKRILGYKK